MVWPTGFMKVHKKEVKEYWSDGCLHRNVWPKLPETLSGGIIIDLHKSNIEEQIRSLLQVEVLSSD